MIAEGKLKLCGLRHKSGEYSYEYDGNELNIDFDYDGNVIYIAVVELKSAKKIPYLIEQLLGRIKRRKYIKIECDTVTKMEEIKKHMNVLKNVTQNVENTDIVIGRNDYPKMNDGILRNCKIRLADEITICHKQMMCLCE
jgi:hypothetical protein